MSLDISFIVCGRNDNYGGYLMDRFNKFINCISILSDKYKIKSEIIFVDWNPIEGKPMWKEVLDTNDIFQKYNQMITFITVPYEEHIKYKNRSPHPLPVLDYLGRNVGIRRSRGKFILTSSPDLIFTDDFFIKIKQGLDPKYVYRAVRYDYKRIDKQFNNYEEYKNFISECDKRVFEKNIEHDMTFTNDRILCDHIFANASGDFLLASREIWNSIKGCSEITDMFSHLDTGTLRKLVTQGEQWILPLSCVIYHQDHERPHIGKSNDYVSLYENDNNWGLNNIELKSITFNVIYETQIKLIDKHIISDKAIIMITNPDHTYYNKYEDIENTLLSITDRYNKIIITKDTIKDDINIISSFNYHVYNDIIGYDVYKGYNSISSYVKELISNTNISAVNTKGYFKQFIDIPPIVNNPYLEYGGIFVKTNNISNINIHVSALDILDKNIIPKHFNIIE